MTNFDYNSNDVLLGSFTGTPGQDALTIHVLDAAPTVDLSGVVFNSWNPGSPDFDSIVIDGTSLTVPANFTGSVQPDTITGSSGNDTVVGFTLGDAVHGGDGFDTITLTATSAAALNAATNGEITEVEAISAAAATGPVVIDLSLQSDGFKITGSALPTRSPAPPATTPSSASPPATRSTAAAASTPSRSRRPRPG